MGIFITQIRGEIGDQFYRVYSKFALLIAKIVANLVSDNKNVFLCLILEWLNIPQSQRETSFSHVLILHVFLGCISKRLNIYMTRKKTYFPYVLILHVFLGFPSQWLNIHMTRKKT